MSYPVFAAGDVLGAADMNGVGLWLVKTQTVGSGVSSVTVTSAFTSDYDNYRIVYIGGNSTGNNNFAFTLGSSTTGYSEALIYNLYSAAAVNGVNRPSQANWVWCGSASTTLNALILDVYRPNLAVFTTYANANWSLQNANGQSSGVHEVATAYTSFTIAPTAGTITGGTIRVYGYRN